MNLFEPDGKMYCCGDKAREEKFARHWVKLQKLHPMPNSILQITMGYIQERYKRDKVLPKLKVVKGEIVLKYERDES